MLNDAGIDLDDKSQRRTLHDCYRDWRRSTSERLNYVDLAPDLSQAIGSRRWFRGLGTMLLLGAAAVVSIPDFAPLEASPAMALDAASQDEFRSHMIMPLALGGDSGRHMGATPLVQALARTPERPQLQMVATLSHSDNFRHMLERAGVGRNDAVRARELVSNAVALSQIEPGTQVDITLGRRPAPGQPRPLDGLSFRARFDLQLAIERHDTNLALKRIPIRVDETPLRIRGIVGNSLYRSARAAGAPASAVQQYLSALGDHMDIENGLRPTDTFDIIVAHRRAETGERKSGRLLYAGVERNAKPKVQLMRWGRQGKFFEASGVGEKRSGLARPVPGPVSSNFGMRRHPILGYRRMHSGMDFRARHGTPIVAVSNARVKSAGRMGGCGNAVRLNHGGGLETRYCHMSRIAVGRGQGVRRGQVIGYVGSTGLSTGPHLHYEMYRNGRAINPASVQYVSRAQLSGEQLRQFRGQLAQLKTVEEGAALQDLTPSPAHRTVEEPKREIDRLGPTDKIP